MVRLDGASAVVVAVRAVPGSAAMWDLTVSNVHTFAVGTGQFVVHNCPVGPTGSGGTVIIGTPQGHDVPVPAGWQGRVADNGKGLVFQDPSAIGGRFPNANSVRIMDPTAQYPAGYVVY